MLVWFVWFFVFLNLKLRFWTVSQVFAVGMFFRDNLEKTVNETFSPLGQTRNLIKLYEWHNTTILKNNTNI